MFVKYCFFSVLVIAALGAIGVTTALMNNEVFAAASGNANPVSGGANTNGPYQTGCKQSSTAQQCATGTGNNGEYTSSLAQYTNKP